MVSKSWPSSDHCRVRVDGFEVVATFNEVYVGRDSIVGQCGYMRAVWSEFRIWKSRKERGRRGIDAQVAVVVVKSQATRRNKNRASSERVAFKLLPDRDDRVP